MNSKSSCTRVLNIYRTHRGGTCPRQQDGGMPAMEQSKDPKGFLVLSTRQAFNKIWFPMCISMNIHKRQFQKCPYWSFLTCQDHGGRGRNQGSDWYPAELDQGYGDPWKGLLTHPWRCLPSGNIIFVQGIVFFNIVALEKQVFPFCLNSTTTWLLIINIQLNGWPGSPRTIRKTQQQWPWWERCLKQEVAFD